MILVKRYFDGQKKEYGEKEKLINIIKSKGWGI